MATEGSRTAVVAAVIGNSAIAVAKFVAAAVTGSAAMFSEGIHSVADAGNQVMLLWGLSTSKRKPDPAHPFGWGKEVYFWSFMVAVVLFVGGAVLSIERGIEAVRQPHELESILGSVVVLVVAIVIEAVSFGVALREFNRVRGSRATWRSIRASKDAALLVVLLEDSAAMAGLLIALAGIGLAVVTENPVWDGVTSIAIGILLALIALVLAIETKSLLVGEAAGRRDRAHIRSLILAHPNVEQVGRLLTMHFGPGEILVNVDVDLVHDLGRDKIEQTIDEIETSIRKVIPAAHNIFVELDSVRG